MGKLIASQIQGSGTAPVLTLPTTAPTAGQLIASDGSGNLSFTNTIPTQANITATGTVSAASGLISPYIRSTSGSTNFTLPTTDGTSGQFLSTNGSGILTFQGVVISASGASNPTSSTAGFIGEIYVNTTSLEYFCCVGIRSTGSYQWYGSNGTSINIPQGQQQYTTPGTYSFVVPSGVTVVSAVCVGAGGGGSYSWAGYAGNGGALAYANNISVTPGSTITVVVGAGGTSSGGGQGTAGGASSLAISGTTLFTAQGGTGNPSTPSTTRALPVAGSVTCYGGAGGLLNNSPAYYNGGGGAGGYGLTTNGSDAYGGNGGSGSGGGSQATAGASGGGGGGSGYYSSTYGFGGGGGVGLFGLGANGAAGVDSGGNTFNASCYGGGGSGGANGVDNTNGTTGGNGGLCGGGGAASGTSSNGYSSSCTGGNGGVNIIWGPGRYFPSNRTSNQPVIS